LKNKSNKDERSKQNAEASIVKFDYDGDVLFATSIGKGNVSDWILDSRCTYHMCSDRD